MDDKIYTHNGRKFKLRKEFLLRDLDKSQRIDAFFSNTMKENSGTVNMGSFTADDVCQFVADVFVPLDNEPVTKEFFEDMKQAEFFEVLQDFFFVYMENSIATGKSLEKFINRVTQYQKNLSGSKIN